MANRVLTDATRWLSRFWGDLKASTDANLLGVLRFLGLIYGPIDTTAPIGQALRTAMRRRLPAHVGPRHALGGITYLLLIVLVVTGVLLSFYYRPSAQEAAHSVQHVVSGVRMGWLIRDMHVWAATFIVITALAHLAQVFLDGSYKPPRETNWLAGMLLLFVIFAFGVTGYLLPWDQVSYWTVTEQLENLGKIPVIGTFVVELLRGDPVVSGATLSRFFAWHVIILPWMAMGLLLLHFALLRKHGMVAPDDLDTSAQQGMRFFPDHLLRSISVAAVVIAVLITAAVLFPREVMEMANPARPPAALGASWIMADVIRGLTYHLGPFGMALFILGGIALALLPILDRSPERRLSHRRVAGSMAAAYVVVFLAAWLYGRTLRDDAPRGAAPAVTVYQAGDTLSRGPAPGGKP